MPKKFFTTPPIVTYDGIDEKGHRAEVQLIKGFAPIEKVEEKGSAVQFVFNFPGKKYPNSAWVPQSFDLAVALKDCYDKGEPVFFRLEKHRKPGIDRTIPIADLDKDQCRKSLAGFRLSDEDNWTLSPVALTNPDEDPGTNRMYSAATMTPEQLSNAAQTSNPAPVAQSNTVEPAPFVSSYGDGSLTLSGYASDVPLNMYLFVRKVCRDNGVEIDDAVNRQLATSLVKVSNMVQMKMYARFENTERHLSRPDLGRRSHTVARNAVCEIVNSVLPLTSDVMETRESVNKWLGEVADAAFDLWSWSVDTAQDMS